MSQIHVYRILDASLNRAAEGLRVVEDFVRFVLNDPFLTAEIKTIRHELAHAASIIASDERHAARDTQRDVGTTVSTEGESTRQNTWAVCAANIKRAEQSLRSIEEYGKLIDLSVGRQAESLRYRLYTLEKAIDIGRLSRERLQDVRLCVLVDGRQSMGEFERLVRALVDAGVGMIQLRDKALDDRSLMERAKLLVTIAKEPSPNPSQKGRGSALAIINDRADVAAVVGADGVHVGQDDLTVKDARAIVGPRMLVGVSTHNIDQARRAVLDGANYLGAGPTFVSPTKPFEEFAGLEYLSRVALEISLPTFAIGGITAQNLPDVMSSGITRIAVASAVTESSDPPAAATAFMAMLTEASARQFQCSI